VCVVISSVEGDVSGYGYFSQESRSRVPVGCVPKGDERADATALITLPALHRTALITLPALHRTVLITLPALYRTVLITLRCTVSYCTDHIALYCIVLY
jgi:hypothetical protein